MLFERASEYEDFLRLVVWAKEKCPVRITAYSVMGNHWHFVFWVEVEWDVSSFLHQLTTTHAMHWRRLTNTVGYGSVYQGRFRGTSVFSERYYYNLIRYVEQNPLRAGLVRHCRDWRWSSLAERLGNGRGILSEGPVDLPSDWAGLIDNPLDAEALKEIRSSLKPY